jgi:beta-galactosidase
MDHQPFKPGKFMIGCNYWASHAGMQMWKDWQPQVIETDFQQLSEAGLQVLRVFPLWPIFQPLTQLYGGGGSPYEIRNGEEPNQADGVSPEAMGDFELLADLAEKYRLKLIVGLLTGWMSGRLFVPPALEGRNVLTDPVAIMWETRFVRRFVRQFKNHPAIIAWDLGNECNVMAPVSGHAAAWTWTSAISNAIRLEDPLRPVVSGMHSLDEPDENGDWRIRDQAELTDILTTHPYPYFTPHCDMEPIHEIRNGLHATAQTRWYSDIGRIPAMAEEVGTLGPMFASPQVAEAYARMALFSLWAHDCHGLLWWCAYDQDRLAPPPYDWTAIERELGLFRSDRTAKPVLTAFSRFRQFLESLSEPVLPPRLKEAVCILTHGQEPWGIAHSSFILSKQSGFDLVFQYADQPLEETSFYLMPSVSGDHAFSRRFWYELDERIRAGATLYLSVNDALFSPFEAPIGLQVQTREKRTATVDFRLSISPDPQIYNIESPVKYTFSPISAEVLGTELDGNPVFSKHPWGKGQIYFLSMPIERYLSSKPGGFSGINAQPFWMIYSYMAAPFIIHRAVKKENPFIGVTEHSIDEKHRVVILVNYSPSIQKANLTLMTGWQIDVAWYGSIQEIGQAAVPANDSLVFTIKR